jgi:hypothetical protein
MYVISSMHHRLHNKYNILVGKFQEIIWNNVRNHTLDDKIILSPKEIG